MSNCDKNFPHMIAYKPSMVQHKHARDNYVLGDILAEGNEVCQCTHDVVASSEHSMVEAGAGALGSDDAGRVELHCLAGADGHRDRLLCDCLGQRCLIVHGHIFVTVN